MSRADDAPNVLETEDHEIADVDLTIVGAAALICAAVVLMGASYVSDWVRARIGSDR